MPLLLCASVSLWFSVVGGRGAAVRIRIGSRGSALALWQAEHVKARLLEMGHAVEIQVITTTGDRVLDAPLESVGGKGAFLKEIEEAMLAGHVDLAVHSLKDVPTALPEGLGLCSILERADPRDALISASGRSLAQLPAGTRVGTTSLRRRAQLAAFRPDLSILDLRGNVDTRLRRLREGRFDAILLAMAGLGRLGRAEEVTEALDPAVMLPAPGQGAIALECRTEAADVVSAVAALHHEPTARCVAAERAFLAALGGGCNVPLGAFAEPDSAAGFRLRALVARPDGSSVLRGELRGGNAERLGRALADDLLARGAGEILQR
jgi:hydroxymethylbilane synthase